MAKGNGAGTAPSAIDHPLDTKTLSGDLAAFIVGQLKGVEKPWRRLSEREQGHRIADVRMESEMLIRRVAGLIAGAGFPSIGGVIESVAIKDGVEFKVTALRTEAADFALVGAYKQETRLVMPQAARFIGERKAIIADPDQPSLLDDIDHAAALDQAATPADSPSAGPGAGSTTAAPGDSAAKGGPSSLQPVPAAEIGDRLIAEGSRHVKLPRRLVAALRKELARAPQRLAQDADTQLTDVVWTLALGDDRLYLIAVGAEIAIGYHYAGGLTFAGASMDAKKVAAFITSWLAEGEHLPSADDIALAQEDESRRRSKPRPPEHATAGDKPAS